MRKAIHPGRCLGLSLLGGSLLGLAACASLPGLSSGLDRITAPALQGHMRFLADDLLAGRMTGEPGYDIAARYVESQFREIGLLAGMGQSFFQPVPLLSGQLDIPRSTLRLPGLAGGDSLKFRDDYVVWPNLVEEKQQLRAPLIFAGHGVVAPDMEHDDYAGLDVEGKIVVIFGRAPKNFPADQRAFYSSGTLKAKEAAARGAVGIIGIRNSYSRERYPWAERVKNAGRQPDMQWVQDDGQPADSVASIRGRATLSDDLAERLFAAAAHPLDELLELESSGQPLPRFELDHEAEIRTRTKISRLSSPNVLGRLPGSDPALAGEHLVLVAHLDHLGVGAPVDGDKIYNGAYDNALGVSLMIEVARALKETGTRRSVLFAAVTAEEMGLLGSRYLATHPPTGVDKMIAALSLDMPMLFFPLGEVIGFGAEHSNLGDYVRRAAEAEGATLAADPMPDEVLFVRTDHYSFVKEGAPGLFFMPGFNSADPAVDGQKQIFGHLGRHYHKPSDDMQRPVHWPSAVKFARINARLAADIANSSEAPAWVPGNFFAAQYQQ